MCAITWLHQNAKQVFLLKQKKEGLDNIEYWILEISNVKQFENQITKSLFAILREKLGKQNTKPLFDAKFWY